MIIRMSEYEDIIFIRSLKRKFTERCCDIDSLNLELSFSIDSCMNEDEYKVSSDGSFFSFISGGLIGLYSAAGSWLRKSDFDGYGNFKPFTGNISLKPDNPIHGMYFASHFGNYYVGAPIDELENYIEDLAFNGCNALMAWYDMHHFSSVDVPASRDAIAQILRVFTHATKVGMKTVLTTLANEAFSSSPQELRAEWTAQNGYHAHPQGHYHLEVCPSREGGIDEIIRERSEMLSAFDGIRIDYITIWPYDQGGCTCEKCTPWGANGFIKTLDALLRFYNDVLPESRILCSTWYFDRFITGEWSAFNDIFSQRCKDNPLYEKIEYLFGYFANEEPVPDFIRNGDFPGGKRMIAFPEISMHGAYPWGAYGANPMPSRFSNNYLSNGNLYCGALPYSEGIYEDINKFLMIGFYSEKDSSAHQLLRDYAKFEFCLPDVYCDDFIRLTEILERTLGRYCSVKEGEGSKYERAVCCLSNPSEIEEECILADKLNDVISPEMKKAWRWRIIYLRTRIDLDIKMNGGKLSEKQIEYANELCDIYHAENAYVYVTPLTQRGVELFGTQED